MPQTGGRFLYSSSAAVGPLFQGMTTTNPFGSLVREPELVSTQLGTERRRAKNTLLVTASLLALQSREIVDPVAKANLNAAEERVRVMIALYERLARGPAGGQIDLSDALQEMATTAVRLHAPGNVSLHVFTEPLQVEWELAIPLALLAHELVTDALACAFVGRSAGRLDLSLRISALGADAVLTVGDDGVSRSPLANGDGVRPKLVDVLLRQLRARLSLESVSGTRLAVRFPLAV